MDIGRAYLKTNNFLFLVTLKLSEFHRIDEEIGSGLKVFKPTEFVPEKFVAAMDVKLSIQDPK